MTDKTRFEQEIRIMQQMRHPNVVHLYDLRRDENYFYLFMEYCPNGELFEHIVASGRLSEDAARVFFKNILDGLAFIHHFNYAHRDLKPENILIDAQGFAKISDFGLAKYVGPTGIASTLCGSPLYASPEIISSQKEYNAKKCDMWSAGIILYAMVTGQLPWTTRNQNRLFGQIIRCNYRIPSYVSQECANLIKGLVCLNPNSRLSVEEALNSPFMRLARNEEVEWKEVPLISLRRLDQFFGKEPSEEIIKLPYRPSSAGRKVRKTFKKTGRFLLAPYQPKDQQKKKDPT